MREIGGEFWEIEKGISQNSFAEGKVLTASGRAALRLIIDQLEGLKKLVAVPIYTCDYLFDFFTDFGWEIEFYNVSDKMRLEPDEIERVLKVKPSIILFHDYFGFSTSQHVYGLLDKARESGVVVVEDVTHRLFSSDNSGYKNSDFKFASLRKWTGLKDGGYAIDPSGKVKCPSASMDTFTELRAKAQSKKKFYFESAGSVDKEEYLSLYNICEQMLAGDFGAYQMSETSASDLLFLDIKKIISTRRSNYIYLSANCNFEFFDPVFKDLGDGICPLMFPIVVKNGRRNEVRQYLIEDSIYCPVHWPLPDHWRKKFGVNEQFIGDYILSVPIDQRYNVEDMKRIIRVFELIDEKLKK